MSADPFAAMGAAAGKAGAKPAVEYTVVPVAPADEPTSASVFDDRRLGTPSRCWPYRDAAGLLVSVVARYETLVGKETRPWIHARKGGMALPAWHMKSQPIPRALYQLPELLAAADGSTIMVTEGEKAADAAQVLFPAYVATTSVGGSSSAQASDWAAVHGRHVLILPDHDDAGRRYTADVIALCRAAGALSVRAVTWPADFPEKWDVADPLPDGFTAGWLLDAIRDAPEATSAAETDAAAIARLAALPEMDYARVRLSESKRMGVPVGVLDRQVAAARKASAPASAKAATARRHEPWPEPVALADVLDGLAAALRRHMILPAGAAEAVALWVAHTWVYDRFERTPRLTITSATKRCGKSTLMEILHPITSGQQPPSAPLPCLATSTTQSLSLHRMTIYSLHRPPIY
jgi:hypothetical protein